MDEKLKILEDFKEFAKRNYNVMHFTLINDAVEAYEKKIKIEAQAL